MSSPASRPDDAPLVLVTGASGYIGGRLVPALLEAGLRVRAMARHADRLEDRPWRDQVEVVEADVGDPASLDAALEGIDVAYYLIHAMGGGRSFAERDRQGAQSFADAAARADVRRIVYLGGIHPEGVELSAHMASRKEVGDIMLAGPVPAVVLRAAVILGSGSASFEIMRHLAERLPVMIAPQWVRNRIQPTAVRDVLHYLVAAARLEGAPNRTFDVGGPDVLTFAELLHAYARAAGLPRRPIRTVPVLTPRLASHWIGLVTPVPTGIARPLVESLIHESVAAEHDLRDLVPAPEGGLTGVDRAIELALTRIRELDVATAWHSATPAGAPSAPLPEDPDWSGGIVRGDQRERRVDASAETLWDVIEGIGGRRGWYSWRLGWIARGLMDRFVGGPGLRRGRRHPDRLVVGDALDWWRVERIEDGRLLRLRAEMRLPGQAWLELAVEPTDDRRAILHQRAIYHPRGLLGDLYWWAVWPFHGIVFGGMQRNIARAAETAAPGYGRDRPTPHDAATTSGVSRSPDDPDAPGGTA
ncbi:NAD(P)-dependent oxidoreductase [Brachybacterium avium]|uniref:NAD(P)-dependent oxidoreductase n=1 Tax=Brachybacterium avium TaxID=2017485 RepID=A0A220UEI8_9MICO|nr:SDR family oxidoreductase [Brachybacterium avium]ASK66123.1 NAD(P)-dependent oxidoreductase [Brachybacterium avium]